VEAENKPVEVKAEDAKAADNTPAPDQNNNNDGQANQNAPANNND
jgi:hypothetical protein